MDSRYYLSKLTELQSSNLNGGLNMPWNEPGGKNRNNDPWGGGNKNQGPPALDKIIADFLKKIRALMLGKKSNSAWEPSQNQNSGFIFSLVFVVIAVIWFVSGFFIVNPAEEAVILRFGKYYQTMQPGLHWHARFIDSKYLVDVRKIYSFSLQGDFLTKSSEKSDLPEQAIEVDADAKELSLDQSKNLINVEMNVQYKISNPEAYLFNVVNPDATINAVALSSLSAMVGQMKLDEVLTTGRENLSTGVYERVKKVMGGYDAGLEVVTVTLRKVQAPDQVREAFNDVNRADQDKATYIQQAMAYASKVVPLAEGVAARTLADARAYEQKTVLVAQGKIAKYQALLSVYLTSPDVTKQRMYYDTMQNVYKNTSKVLVDGKSSNNMIYLPIDKLINNKSNSTGGEQ